LWDWDGFLISLHLARRDKPEAMKCWALSFIDAAGGGGMILP
jgi:hypothetical protein